MMDLNAAVLNTRYEGREDRKTTGGSKGEIDGRKGTAHEGGAFVQETARVPVPGNQD